MKTSQGLYNNHGYVQIRVFPNGKGPGMKPYTEGGFGLWTAVNIAKAERRLRILREEIDSGKFQKHAEERILTISEACDIYHDMAFVRNPERSAGSRKSAFYILKVFKDRWPTYKFHELPASEIRAFAEDLTKQGRSAGTVKRYLGPLQALYNRITDWSKTKLIEPVKLPEFNPVEPVERPSTKNSARKRMASITELTAYKRWCEANDPELWLITLNAVITLYRAGDLKKAHEKGTADIIAGKTGKRSVMPVELQHLNMVNRRKRWEAARAGAGMANFHWHDWRHTGASTLYVMGVPETIIQAMLGHSTIEQTRAYLNSAVDVFRPHIAALKEHLEKL